MWSSRVQSRLARRFLGFHNESEEQGDFIAVSSSSPSLSSLDPLDSSDLYNPQFIVVGDPTSTDDDYAKYGQYGADLNGLTQAVVKLSALGSITFLIAIVIVYTLLHVYNVWPQLYASRRVLWPTFCQDYETPPNRRNIFTWLTDTYIYVSDVDIIKIYGMDTCIYFKSILTQCSSL